MVKRFSRLNYALKTLKNPNDDDNSTENVNAPAGTVLAKYQKSKQSSVSYGSRDAGSKTQGLVEVATIPFAEGVVNNNKAKLVGMSKRAHVSALASLVKAACNYEDYVPANHDLLSLYKPAQAIIFEGTGYKSEKPSKITGIKYKPRNGNSYTFPFGAETAKTLKIVRDEIKMAATSIRQVSFKNEVYPNI